MLTIDPLDHIQDLPFFEYTNDTLIIDGVACQTLAKTYGTPLYVYSQNAIEQAYNSYATSFKDIDTQICYAVKANSNLSVLKTLADLGAGFDIVSKGELARVLQVTCAKKVVYSGVGKTYDDIYFALSHDIDCFNVEAFSELDLINQVAKDLHKTARISIRINPDVDAQTHPYISTGLKDNKFGISHDKAVSAYLHAKNLPNLAIVGIDCHIGSQLTQVAPFVDALDKVIELIDELKTHDIHLTHIDLGGGLGVRYTNEQPASIQEYAQALLPKLQKLGLKVYFEPGRNIVANAGVLLTQVNVLKQTDFKNFAIVDASMTELIRPALYQSVMAIIPTSLDIANQKNSKPAIWSVVGAVCESSDVLGDDRHLDIKVGDILAITGAGAYGFSMASNYNSRPRPCEVMVKDGTHRIIRQRECLDDLWRGESI